MIVDHLLALVETLTQYRVLIIRIFMKPVSKILCQKIGWVVTVSGRRIHLTIVCYGPWSGKVEQRVCRKFWWRLIIIRSNYKLLDKRVIFREKWNSLKLKKRCLLYFDLNFKVLPSSFLRLNDKKNPVFSLLKTLM